MNDEELIQAMISGTKIVVRDKQHAAAQLAHLKKYRNRPVKRLADDVNLPESVIRRFKELTQKKMEE